MKINIDIDDKHEHTSITIQAKEWSEEIEELVNIIKKRKPQRLFGIEGEQTIILEPNDIEFVYAEQRKVFDVVVNIHIDIKMKLYINKKIHAPYKFMSFTKSVIDNLSHIHLFELSFNGNLCVYFHSGNKEYISRKYVMGIKEKLLNGGPSNENND